MQKRLQIDSSRVSNSMFGTLLQDGDELRRQTMQDFCGGTCNFPKQLIILCTEAYRFREFVIIVLDSIMSV